MTPNPLNTKIGILGGGQLGRMLCLAGADWNLDISILDFKDCPAKNFCTSFVEGNIMSYDDVLSFGRTVDVVTIEIEHVNIEALEQLVKEGIKVYPNPAILRTINDKSIQKEFYISQNIPTSNFQKFENKEQVLKWVAENFNSPLESVEATPVSPLESSFKNEGIPSQAENDDAPNFNPPLGGVEATPVSPLNSSFKNGGIPSQAENDDAPNFNSPLGGADVTPVSPFLGGNSPYPFVQKTCIGGYDGKGVVVIKDDSDLSKLLDGPCIIEEMVSIQKELAVIIARNESGETKSYPVAEMEFGTTNLVEFLFTPANIVQNIETKCQKIALKIADKLNLIGILAVEFFLSKDGRILVNEIAPRTHNSGHHTIEGSATSQFEQQLRAILNLPLGDTTFRKHTAMVNLVGENGYEGKVKVEGLEKCLELPEFHLHLYGKSTTKPNRKMGHATVLADTFDEIVEKSNYIRQNLKIKSQ